MGQREQGQEQLIISRKLSPTRTNKEHITRLSNVRYHVTTILPPVYTYIQLEYSRMKRNVKPPRENKNKIRRTDRRTVI
jgi:hypothetical protein